MIPLLKTCCSGLLSVRTAALLVAALFIFGSGVHFFVNIVISSGNMYQIYGSRGCIDVMLINVVCIVVNILLIVGIEKRKLSLMRPAAVYYLLMAAYLFAATCTSSFFISSSEIMSVVIIVEGLLIAIFYYFWLIVYSYYRQLKNELLVNSVGEELNSPLAVVSYPCPKQEDERELPHHRT